jgi:hypothetical protein
MEEIAATAVRPRMPTRIRAAVAAIAGAAALGLGVVAAVSAGAPAYTEWSAPVSLGPVVNSTSAESGPVISRSGLSLYFHSTRAGGLGGFDLWVSRRATASDPWGSPVNLGPTINSAVEDSLPALSADGHRLFFSSARPGGFGSTDIWASYRADADDDFGWEAPVNLGANVNTSVADSGHSYFANEGGHPQLYFGSDRPGGLGERDLYVSELQPDGSWGPASWLPELSSPFLETRPAVRADGLEIVFGRAIAPASAVADLWVSTRAAVDAPWSPPVNVGPPVNTSASDAHPFLSPDGRMLFLGSNRPGALGSTDIYVATRAAELTVTANDQGRLFGQANAPLTYELGGFVGGETSAVVSGTALCSTTATPASPAGDYPITCSVGSLSAPGYVFETFVAGMLAVGYSRPCLTGPSSGPLRVAAGEAVCIGAGGSQTGPVTVAPGGSLDVEGGRITGRVVANGAAVVRICGATITGPLTVTGSTGPVVVGGEGCDPNTIVGPVRITDNTGGVEVDGNTVVGPLRITGNAAPTDAAGNTVTGPATIQP